jgi:hypothetical protein
VEDMRNAGKWPLGLGPQKTVGIGDDSNQHCAVILVALLEAFILALYRRCRKTAACEGVLPAIK